MKNGWPMSIASDDLKPYWACKTELTVEGECILRGIRVVVPQKLRCKVHEELHMSHPGINRMKLLARSHVWWPHIGREIE